MRNTLVIITCLLLSGCFEMLLEHNLYEDEEREYSEAGVTYIRCDIVPFYIEGNINTDIPEKRHVARNYKIRTYSDDYTGRDEPENLTEKLMKDCLKETNALNKDDDTPYGIGYIPIGRKVFSHYPPHSFKSIRDEHIQTSWVRYKNPWDLNEWDYMMNRSIEFD